MCVLITVVIVENNTWRLHLERMNPIDLQEEPSTIIQGGREVWEDAVNDGWMTPI